MLNVTLKVMAVLRTLFLFFFIYVALRAWPVYWNVAPDRDYEYRRVASAVERLKPVVWYAGGWVVLEVAVGWWLALRKPKPLPAEKAAVPPAVA